MQNFNPMVLQDLLRNLQIQQYQPENQIAYLDPSVQETFNRYKRLDPTLTDKALNYITTTQQINMQRLRPWIPSDQLDEAQKYRDYYNRATGQNL